MFHTARWEYDYSGGSSSNPVLDKLADKRVGIIGTGDTALQAIPYLGKYAKQLDSTIDDGEPGTGSLRVLNSNHVRGAVGMGLAAVNDSASYIVCMGL